VPQRPGLSAFTPSKNTRRRKDPSLKVPTLTPYCVHDIQDHQKKKRPQPQGTYDHALLRTRYTRPPGEEQTPASRDLRSRPTTYTQSKTTARRTHPSLKVPTLTPYYVHAIQEHYKKKRSQPQGTYVHALLRTRHTRPPAKEHTPASRYLRSRPTTYTSYKITRRRKDTSIQVPTLTP
jgi:hypothetical protein